MKTYNITQKRAERLVKRIPAEIKILANEWANTLNRAKSNKILIKINALKKFKKELNSFLLNSYKMESKKSYLALRHLVSYMWRD